MLKVASIFSGIGAFEFALKRMGIEHEILFACDNGERDVEIDYKKEFELYNNTVRLINNIVNNLRVLIYIFAPILK